MTPSTSFRRTRKADWMLAAAAAFVLCVADCMCRNRDTAVFENPDFFPFLLVCGITFASFSFVFLFSHWWLSAPLLATGGVCVYLFAPEIRAPYFFIALPALLTVFLFRFSSDAKKRSPVAAIGFGVLSALELAGIIFLLRSLIAANTSLFDEILPFSKWQGHLNNNYYGMVLLACQLFAYGFLFFRERRGIGAAAEKKTSRKKKKKEPNHTEGTGGRYGVWMHFAAVCLFFILVILWILLNNQELFLPVASFVNLVAVFVLTAQLTAGPSVSYI